MAEVSDGGWILWTRIFCLGRWRYPRLRGVSFLGFGFRVFRLEWKWKLEMEWNLGMWNCGWSATQRRDNLK